MLKKSKNTQFNEFFTLCLTFVLLYQMFLVAFRIRMLGNTKVKILILEYHSMYRWKCTQIDFKVLMY